jgi:hypothetical protein
MRSHSVKKPGVGRARTWRTIDPSDMPGPATVTPRGSGRKGADRAAGPPSPGKAAPTTPRGLAGVPIMGGDQDGRTPCQVMLEDPGWVLWAIDNHPFRLLAHQLLRLERAFDAKPFVETCDCGRPATCATVAGDAVDRLYFWCAKCADRACRAHHSGLAQVRTYREAVTYVAGVSRRRRDRRTIVRALARGKGLEGRVSARRASAFFFDDSPA